ENLARRIPAQPVKLMVSAMRIANETGGGLAETLERTATTLRSQHAMALKIRALTAQGKLQAWVVGLLPVFLLWVLHRMEPDAMAPSVGLSASVVACLVSRAAAAVRQQARSWLDAPPPGYRIVWWPVQWLAHYLRALLPERRAQAGLARLRLAGLDYALDAA